MMPLPYMRIGSSLIKRANVTICPSERNEVEPKDDSFAAANALCLLVKADNRSRNFQENTLTTPKMRGMVAISFFGRDRL